MENSREISYEVLRHGHRLNLSQDGSVALVGIDTLSLALELPCRDYPHGRVEISELIVASEFADMHSFFYRFVGNGLEVKRTLFGDVKFRWKGEHLPAATLSAEDFSKVRHYVGEFRYSFPKQ